MKTVSPEGTARRSSTSTPPPPQPFFAANSPPPSAAASGVEAGGKVSPGLLLAIVILAVVFFVSGLIHLLVRVLMARHSNDPEDSDSVTALQGQLQQLFHLHDSGVDQSFIDALPVFHYRAIIGLKHPFDCAVCLCEFGGEDRLRLLPKCSHAFHMECIDTWLLSHSTCPLCRSSLLPDFPSQNGCSPVVLVLESGRESSREMLADAEADALSPTTRSLLGFQRGDGLGTSRIEVSHKSADVLDRVEESPPPRITAGLRDSVLPVKLGKFRNIDGGGGEGRDGESDGIDARRCFSMGSFRYVMDENSSLRVPIRTPVKRRVCDKPPLPWVPGLRSAISECDCESKREFDDFEAIKRGNDEVRVGSRRIGSGGGKRESFSVSKIWLRDNRHENPASDPSRRAFSLRFPVNGGGAAASAVSAAADWKPEIVGGRDDGRRTVSEIDFRRWENRGGGDEENQSHNSLDSQANAPSFARRTLLWLMGRQSKVVQSPSSPHV